MIAEPVEVWPAATMRVDGQPQMIATVRIEGDGIAACCCSQLLSNNGVAVATRRTSHPRLPAILLSQSTRTLLSDVFESNELFAGAHQIRKRVVAWGSKAETLAMPHFAWVVSENNLLNHLWSRIPIASDMEPPNAACTIYSSSHASFPGLVEELHFGSRIARTCSALLKENADQEACWIESTETGWLFLLPTGGRNASLISVGEEPGCLLAQSHLVAEQIELLSGAVSKFAAYPRMLSALSGDNWLACGTGAVSFDPLCGEGAGNAVREAILAAAVIRGIIAGFDRSDLLALYSARLKIGFLRHLKICREFYRSGGNGPFWKSELDFLEKGIRNLQSHAVHASKADYQLIGFDLRKVASSESNISQHAATLR